MYFARLLGIHEYRYIIFIYAHNYETDFKTLKRPEVLLFLHLSNLYLGPLLYHLINQSSL